MSEKAFDDLTGADRIIESVRCSLPTPPSTTLEWYAGVGEAVERLIREREE